MFTVLFYFHPNLYVLEYNKVNTILSSRDSTTSRADITTPVLADSSMRICLRVRGRDSWGAICLPIVQIDLWLQLMKMDIEHIF